MTARRSLRGRKGGTVDDQVLLITGASRGIGAATALLAGGKGFAVAVNYTRNEAAAQEVVAAIRAAGGKAVALQGDVAEEAQVLTLFAQVDRQLGRLTALVNNAGIVDRTARVEEMSVERLKRMFDVNVIGSIVCAREAIKRMSTRHGGQGGVIRKLRPRVPGSSRASVCDDPANARRYIRRRGNAR